MVTLYEELIEYLVDYRLRLKSFGKESTLLDKDEPLDCLFIVLDGHMKVVSADTGEVLCKYHKD